MKKIFANCFRIFIYCILMGLLPLQSLHASVDLFHMPSPNNKTVLVKINPEAVSCICSYRQLVGWCEEERSFDLDSQLWGLSFILGCGEECIQAYNRNTMPPPLLWMMLRQPLCRDYLWMVTRNQLPVVQKEWKYLSMFPEWPCSRGWLPVLIIPFNQELIFHNSRQQPVSLGSRPYLCVVVQGIAQLGEYTKRDQHGRDKRYGIFSTVNWTLMYDVENHCYANESPGTVQVFHFKPKSHPLTTKQAPHILHYHCPTIPPFDLPENMPTPDEVKFK